MVKLPENTFRTDTVITGGEIYSCNFTLAKEGTRSDLKLKRCGGYNES